MHAEPPPDARRIDLHAHTVHSDGTFTPTALVDEAARIGLSALAVTDHDTTTALQEAHDRGAETGVEILDGCEISTSIPTGIVHILTYAFDLSNAQLQDLLERVRTSRDARNAAMLEKLDALRLPLTHEEVARHAHGRIVARPHFARAMVEAGYVDDIRQAFKHYLHDDGPAYVIANMPAPEEAIRATVAAGGVCVLAHPKQLKLGGMGKYRDVVGRFRDAGLAGLEIDHPTHNEKDRERFHRLACDLDLVPSGGSDFHGAAKPHIRLGEGDGTIHVPYATWTALLERRVA